MILMPNALTHHRDDPAWAPLQGEALDATIFLDVSKSLCRERVVARKVSIR
jgi:hypothetical protein